MHCKPRRRCCDGRSGCYGRYCDTAGSAAMPDSGLRDILLLQRPRRCYEASCDGHGDDATTCFERL